MKTIALLCHSSDNLLAKQLIAALRPLLDSKEYEFWQKNQSSTAFGSTYAQPRDAIGKAWVVLLMVGRNGTDEDFATLLQDAIDRRIAADGNEFGRLVIQLPGGQELPAPLVPWVKVPVDDTKAMPVAAQTILERLGIRARWSSSLNMEAARKCIPDGPDKAALVRYFTTVTRTLANGKPATLLIGPYASVEEKDDGSCPSRVRRRLIEIIRDGSLREMLHPLEAAAQAGGMPPLLWQDHLATLCLLSGCTQREVASAIASAVSEAPGDENGSPRGVFQSIGLLAAQLKNAGLPPCRSGLPQLTILTVCPGLRVERALVANGCAFERAALMLGHNTRPELHRKTYRPDQVQMLAAADGESPLDFMPTGEEPQSPDAVEFVRVVKLFGSRDLFQGLQSGDFGQAYDLISQLRLLLEDFVAAAGTGPYLLLGGGLGTPPVQAAHSILLRSVLDKPEDRPLLAIVPQSSASPDRLRQVESGRIDRLTSVRHSGLDRLEVVQGDPVDFLNAMVVAFGGQPPDMNAPQLQATVMQGGAGR